MAKKVSPLARAAALADRLSSSDGGAKKAPRRAEQTPPPTYSTVPSRVVQEYSLDAEGRVLSASAPPPPPSRIVEEITLDSSGRIAAEPVSAEPTAEKAEPAGAPRPAREGKQRPSALVGGLLDRFRPKKAPEPAPAEPENTEDAPAEPVFSTFSDEEEAAPAAPGEEAVPALYEAGAQNAPPKKQSGSLDPAAYASDIWAFAILLGVVCTVAAFFAGALS